MFIYLKALVLVFTFGVSQNVFAQSIEEHEYVVKRVEAVQDLQGLLTLDKKSKYKNELNNVNVYPEMSFKNLDAFSKDFHLFVKSLLPYFLKKLKNQEINGEFQPFHNIIMLSESIDNEIKLSQIESVSYDLLTESLKTEKILRACSHAISKYGDKRLQMELELNRLDGIKSDNMNRAVEITNDYSKLRRSISSSVSN